MAVAVGMLVYIETASAVKREQFGGRRRAVTSDLTWKELGV